MVALACKQPPRAHNPSNSSNCWWICNKGGFCACVPLDQLYEAITGKKWTLSLLNGEVNGEINPKFAAKVLRELGDDPKFIDSLIHEFQVGGGIKATDLFKDRFPNEEIPILT